MIRFVVRAPRHDLRDSLSTSLSFLLVGSGGLDDPKARSICEYINDSHEKKVGDGGMAFPLRFFLDFDTHLVFILAGSSARLLAYWCSGMREAITTLFQTKSKEKIHKTFSYILDSLNKRNPVSDDMMGARPPNPHSLLRSKEM